MRFTVRSLGGKLVISAALMLLLCMLLFSVASWYILKSFYEHEALRDASLHLAASAYQTKIDSLIDDLATEAKLHEITATLSNSETLTPDSRGKLIRILEESPISQEDPLSSSAI